MVCGGSSKLVDSEMDESWRVTMGSVLPNPKRRSVDGQVVGGGHSELLSPEDFSDVFGGPPRTLLLLRHRQRHGSKDPFDAVFRPLESYFHNAATSSSTCRRRGKSCDANVPKGFYDDIFGSDGGGGVGKRSRRRSTCKSTSSSALWCSENLGSPIPSSYSDTTFSSFAPKLKPISIPSRHSSPSGGEDITAASRHVSASSASIGTWPPRPSSPELEPARNKRCIGGNSYDFQQSCRYDTNPFWNVNRMWRGYEGDDSPSSSSFGSGVRMAHHKALQDLTREVVMVLQDDEEDDDDADDGEEAVERHGISSYFVDFSDEVSNRDMERAAAVDEVIARESFRIRMETEGEEEKGRNKKNCQKSRELHQSIGSKEFDEMLQKRDRAIERRNAEHLKILHGFHKSMVGEGVRLPLPNR